MHPTRINLGQILMVLAIALATMWSATQWIADALDYQLALGRPWRIVLGHPVYAPWSLFFWWYDYGAYAPRQFAIAGAISASGGPAAALAAVVLSLWRARSKEPVTTYGSARWAEPKDVRRSGLLGGQGVVLGLYGGRYLRFEGNEHVLCVAPTRTGKGAGLVVPTLLSWRHAAVINDMKGELWQLTAGWRAKIGPCIGFAPTLRRSARYNPLAEVRLGINEVRDVQNIADILVDPEGAIERRSHWEKTSHALLVGVILHVLYAETEKTLARVAALLADPAGPIESFLNRMMTTNHLGTAEAPVVHPVVAASARDLLNKSANERSGVLSTAVSFLTLYRDPLVAAATSASDWHIDDLVNGPRPASLYLIIPTSDQSRARPLVRLVLNQITRCLTEELADETGQIAAQRHALLLMLDEFRALGRLDFFETSLTHLAGFKVRAFLVSQSLSDIRKLYGRDTSIAENCHVKVFFAQPDTESAEAVSALLGTKTEQRTMRNFAGHRLNLWFNHEMVSNQETARPLLTPDEIVRLPSDDVLVVMGSHPPIRARKLRYFSDANFMKRRAPAPSFRPSCPLSVRPRVGMTRVADTDRSVNAGPSCEEEGDVPGPSLRLEICTEIAAPDTNQMAHEMPERLGEVEQDIAAGDAPQSSVQQAFGETEGGAKIVPEF